MWWPISVRTFHNRLWMLLAGFWIAGEAANAQDATWLPDPGSGNWNTAANWLPAAEPARNATFGASNLTTITFSTNTSIGALHFDPGAPAYVFNLSSTLLTFIGAGIVNRSSNNPTFITTGNQVAVDRVNFEGASTAGNSFIHNNALGITTFSNTSTAGHSTITNNVGFTIFSDSSTAAEAAITNINGFTKFTDSSTAGNATIIDGPNETSVFEGGSTAGKASITNNGGGLGFSDASSAAEATITNNAGGVTNFLNTSSVGNATITNNNRGSTVFLGSSTAAHFIITTNSGGVTIFLDTGTAGNANITTNSGGVTEFFDSGTAGNASVTTNSKGAALFFSTSTGGRARFITNAEGIFDISGLSPGEMTAGSIEGAGIYRLGSNTLTVGLNNRSTEVSGTISDGGIVGGTGGALIKIGTGTLTLAGSNSYSGGTSFNGGIVAVRSDANLGTGPLSFDGGTLQALATGGGISSRKTITLNSAGGTILTDAGTASTLRGTISGPGGLTKEGLGTLTLTGAIAYRGDTNINGGTLVIQNGGAMSGVGVLAEVSTDRGDTNVNDGTLIIQNGGTLSDASGLVGNAPGSSGTVSVSGVGSTWTSRGALFVGGNGGGPEGTGLLLITLGGTVNSAANTIWNTGVLAVGRSFTLNGPLTINGGTVRPVADTTFPINATLGAGGAILDSNGFNSIFSGAFAGLGGIVKINAGTIILTGANTYQGGTNINGGILAVSSDGNLGVGALSLNGGTLEALEAGGGIASNKPITLNNQGGTFLADAGTTSILSGSMGGEGALTKDGPGTLILTGANTYKGGTVLNTGILTVDSSYALGTGNVTVNGGTLNADPQPIHVKGNYTQAAGGTLQLQVAGAKPGQYNSLNVGGNATLGGTLQLISLGFQPTAGNVLSLVNTGGTISGRFAQLIDPFAAWQMSDKNNILELLYGRKSVQLLFLNIDLAASVAALTAFDEISFSNANIQRLNLEDRLDDLRNGSSGFSSNMKVNGATVNLGDQVAGDGKSRNVVEPILRPGPGNRWGVWATGFGDFVSVDADAKTTGYHFTTGGISLGIDYQVTDQLVVGVMGEYSHTWTALNPSGHLGADSGRGGLYATWYYHGIYLNGAIYGGHNNYESSRSSLGDLATSSTEGTEWSTFIGAGYDFHFGSLTVGPIASLQYTDVHVDGFSENSSLAPLAVHSGSAESLRSDLGFRAFYQWQIGKILVEPSLRAVWEHEFKYSALPITAGFAGIPSPSATFFGPDEGHDSAVVSAGVSAQLTPAFSISLSYDGQLVRENYNSNAVTGGVRIEF